MPLRNVLSPLNQSESVRSKNATLKDASNLKPNEHPSKERNATVERKKRSPKRTTKKSKQPVTDENQNIFLENIAVNKNDKDATPSTKRTQLLDNKSLSIKRKVALHDFTATNVSPSSVPTTGGKIFSVKKRKLVGSKTVATMRTDEEPVQKLSESQLKIMSRHYEEAAIPQTPKKQHLVVDESSPSSIVVTPKRPSSYAQRPPEPESPLAHRQKSLTPLSSSALESVDLSKLEPRPTKPLLFQTCHKIWPHGLVPDITDIKPLSVMLKERLARAKSKVFTSQQKSVTRYTIPTFSHTTHKPGDSDSTIGNAKNFFSRHAKSRAAPRPQEHEHIHRVESTKSIFSPLPDNDFNAMELVTDANGRMSIVVTPRSKLPRRHITLPAHISKQQATHILSAVVATPTRTDSSLSSLPYAHECPQTPSPKSNRRLTSKVISDDFDYTCAHCHKQYKNLRGLTYHAERCKSRHTPLRKKKKNLYKAAKSDDDDSSDAEEWRDAVTNCICAGQHGDDEEESGPMVQCDTCESWLHLDCIGLDEDNLEEEYFCPRCKGDYVSPTASCHRSTGGKTVAGALEAQLKLQARLKKIKAKQSGNRSLLDRFVQEANNAYLETRMKQRKLHTGLEDEEDVETDEDTTAFDENRPLDECETPVFTEEQNDNSPPALHVWEGFSLNVSPDPHHVWGPHSDAFNLSQASDFFLDDEALNASLSQDTVPVSSVTNNCLPPPLSAESSDFGHITTPADMVALSLKQQPPSSDIYMGSLIDDDDVGTSFASPMTDGEDRHWNPMIKASPYLYMDDTDAITPFALKMGDAGYFDLSSALPLNTDATVALDTWLVTGDNGDVVADALEQDFDGE
ncbi:hypothetical protein INT44_001404 [Umbelopsis vinacea]|uniref:PHD-type domain-containing protein n=1 Tax=Umbelopsis vinacea TaxID=44442 RepID=A0A8H7URW0_9FUNG|nr:hypothetical protein INT44_001404 [Umbelopsis vinacea]